MPLKVLERIDRIDTAARTNAVLSFMGNLFSTSNRITTGDIERSVQEGGRKIRVADQRRYYVDMLKNLGISMDERGEGGNTPLYYAKKRGCWPIVKMLLANGATDVAVK